MSISSDDVNLLIYRYLQESGFGHTAFTFAHESLASRSIAADAQVPPGALISFLQKGLQYVETETHLQEDGTERQCDEPFHLLAPHVCRVKTVPAQPSQKSTIAESNTPGAEFSLSDVTVFNASAPEIYALVWSPTDPLLASGSKFNSVMLWRIPAKDGARPEPVLVNERSSSEQETRRAGGSVISCIEWTNCGSMFAAGSTDGSIVIRQNNGSLIAEFSPLIGEVFAVKFSPDSKNLVACGASKVCAWNVQASSVRNMYKFHTGPVRDIAFLSNRIFATCSSDGSIVCACLDSGQMTSKLMGHADEVNVLAHTAAGPTKYGTLASGGDDGVICLWNHFTPDGDQTELAPFRTLLGHKKAVHYLCFAPLKNTVKEETMQEDDDSTTTSSVTQNVPLLASTSFDGSIRVWNPSAEEPCLHTFTQHKALIYSLSFSPDGRLLVSGSADNTVLVWDVENGSLVKSFTGPSSVLSVSFQLAPSQPAGTYVIAASFATGAMVLLDLSM